MFGTQKGQAMAVTGERFLRLSRKGTIEISMHALVRLRERSGTGVTEADARGLFRSATYVKPWQLRLLGYGSRYLERRQQGEQSWYFRFAAAGIECIAVVTEDEEAERLVWVTTLALDSGTEERRFGSWADVQTMAPLGEVKPAPSRTFHREQAARASGTSLGLRARRPRGRRSPGPCRLRGNRAWRRHRLGRSEHTESLVSAS